MKKVNLFFVNCLFSVLFVVACGGNNGTTGNLDAGTDGGQPLCANVNCDDKIACTRDSCDESTGECRHQVDHALCSAGTVCMPKEGCKSPPPCASDADCPDTDNSPCMQEYCEPASSTCRWNPLDKDGDGHAPQICADIGGDDCDDNDYERHPDVAEICNGQDENCNGQVDEGNPGGGGECRSAEGEGQVGVLTCLEGSLQCVGAVCSAPEVCHFATLRMLVHGDRQNLNQAGKFLNGKSYEVGVYEADLVVGNVSLFGSDADGNLHSDGEEVREIKLTGYAAADLFARYPIILGEMEDEAERIGGTYSDLHVTFGQIGKGYEVVYASEYPKLNGHTLYVSGLAEKGGMQYGFEIFVDLEYELREIPVDIALSGGSTTELLVGFDITQWLYDVDFALYADENNQAIISPETAPDVVAQIIAKMKNNDFVRQMLRD